MIYDLFFQFYRWYIYDLTEHSTGTVSSEVHIKSNGEM